MLSDAMQLFPGDHFSHNSVRNNRYSSMLCDYTLPHGPFPYPQAPLDCSAMSTMSNHQPHSLYPPRPQFTVLTMPTTSDVRHVHCICYVRHIFFNPHHCLSFGPLPGPAAIQSAISTRVWGHVLSKSVFSVVKGGVLQISNPCVSLNKEKIENET